MADLTAQQVEEFFVKCSPAELIQILAPILAKRTSVDHGIERKLALCEFYRGMDSRLGDTTWDLEVVGMPPANEDWKTFESGGYWESGDCLHCSYVIVSYAKRAICPLCGTIVDLT